MYVGSNEGNFKKYYYNHISSFKNETYRYNISLSKYVWSIKQEDRMDPILKHCKYKASNKFCILCMEEKLAIATFNKNQSSEMLNRCWHRKAWLLE